MNPEEREWQAQEAAAHCDRSGAGGHNLDALGASYLSVVRAARQPIEVALPADFATRVALLAGKRPREAEIEFRLEQRLLQALAILLGLAGLAAVILYGGSWLVTSVSLVGQLGKPSLSLLLSLAACLGLSGLWQQFRRIAMAMSGSSA